ncbi:MAG: T9SS type A sorting domain-containing protein [Bacteroidota bacterium]
MKKQILFNLIFAALLPVISFSSLQAQQTPCSYGPELRFTNYTLESGTDKAVGAVYRYTQVLDGVDALIEIQAAANAYLKHLDMSWTGTDSAFQPQVEVISQPSSGGIAYMDFQISFVNANTNQPTDIPGWKATAVDVDGDDYRLRESVAFHTMDNYTVENNTKLDYAFPGGGIVQFDARTVDNQPGITVDATEHMVTAEYFNRSSFLYRAKIIIDPAYDGPSDAPDRMFSLNFNPCLVDTYTDPNSFPVEWVGFDGRVSGETVVLNWTTATELNNDHFVIERSTDGENFSSISSLAGNGTTNEKIDYQFVDRSPVNGDNYYRLKQVDFDGQFAYSEILRLKVEPNNFRYSLYPNPTSDQLHISSTEKEITQIEILDLSGRKISVPSTQSDLYQWTLEVAHLQPGTYLVRVETENSHNPPQKVVIY